MKRIKTAVVGCGSISDIYMTNLTNGKFTVMELVACSDLMVGDAQLPRRGLDEPGHIAVRRQRDITDADHRGSSCFPSIPAT